VRVEAVEKGPGFEVLPGLLAFKWLDFVVTVEDPDCRVEGRLGFEGFRGPYRLERFTVVAGPGMWPGCITGEAMRAISVEEVVTQVLAEHGTELGEGHWGPAHPDWGSLDEKTVIRSGSELRALGTGNESVLGLVAATYMAALLSGRNPAGAVAELLEASPATAGRYIKAAKRHGQLRTTDRSV
jgi:hypothetical protein